MVLDADQIAACRTRFGPCEPQRKSGAEYARADRIAAGAHIAGKHIVLGDERCRKFAGEHNLLPIAMINPDEIAVKKILHSGLTVILASTI